MNQLFVFFLSVTVSFCSSSFTSVNLGKCSKCFDPLTNAVEDSTNTIEKSFSTKEQKMDLEVITDFATTTDGQSCQYLKIKTISTSSGKSAYIYLHKKPDDIENNDAALLKSEEQNINQMHVENQEKSFQVTYYLRIQCPEGECNFKIVFQFQSSPSLGKNEFTYLSPRLRGTNIEIAKDNNYPAQKNEFYVLLHLTNPNIEQITISLACLDKEGKYSSNYLSKLQHFITNKVMFIIDESKTSCPGQGKGSYQLEYMGDSYSKFEVNNFFSYSEQPEIPLNTTVINYLNDSIKEECFILRDGFTEEDYYIIGVESMTKNIHVEVLDKYLDKSTIKTTNVLDDSRKTISLKGENFIDGLICFSRLDSKKAGFTFQIIGDPSGGGNPSEGGNQPGGDKPSGGNNPIEGKASKKSKAGLIAGVCVAVVVVLGGAGGAAVYFLKIRKRKNVQPNNKETDPSRLDTDRPMNSEQIEPTKVEVKQSKV